MSFAQLFRFGFVVYMFVDGYSRYVLNIKVSPYDGSRLVLEQWAAVSRARGYIMPTLFRTDKVTPSSPEGIRTYPRANTTRSDTLAR